jgi:hypothetical protein
MNERNKTASEAYRKGAERQATSAHVFGLDSQFAELMEIVFACEHNWRNEARIDAVIRYGAIARDRAENLRRS